MDCTFTLNRQQFSSLLCDGGRFTAFSGNGPDRNNPESEAVADNGPIPLGSYYIVERQSGGLLGPVRDWVLDRDKWFALYRDDGTVDDQTFVASVQRGQFRLHPLGPRRMSTGCVVLQYHEEFARLRALLLKSPLVSVGDSGLRSYGRLLVAGLLPAILEPEFQNTDGQPNNFA